MRPAETVPDGGVFTLDTTRIDSTIVDAPGGAVSLSLTSRPVVVDAIVS